LAVELAGGALGREDETSLVEQWAARRADQSQEVGADRGALVPPRQI